MHVVVPFAVPMSPAGVAAWRALAWPGLARWWRAGATPLRWVGAADSFSAPHEHAVAQALGWTDVDDGCIPLAPLQAADDGVPDAGRPLALMSPAHWHLGTEQIGMTDPEALELDEATSRALLADIAPLFTSEGFDVAWGAPTRWYVAHDEMALSPTASLDRVIGRNVDPWLGTGARRIRRLQNEVQMLLHAHPQNVRREGLGLPAVNSVWFSGSGPRRPAPDRGAWPRVESRLRRPALAEDWAAWTDAWHRLDADWAAAPPAMLTLCGERGWVRLVRCDEASTPSATSDASHAPGVLQRLGRWASGWTRSAAARAPARPADWAALEGL